MITGAEVIAEARRWVEAGTPFRHQARVCGAGADCLGLIGGVATTLGMVRPEWWSQDFDTRYAGYARTPSLGALEAGCEEFMQPIRIEDCRIGDVVRMNFGAQPNHLAFIADYRHGGASIIHALSTVGKVCEHRLSPEWRARITGAYRLPGVTA